MTTIERAIEMTEASWTYRCTYCRETTVTTMNQMLPNDTCYNKNTMRRHRWHNWKFVRQETGEQPE